jgi:hypothetical protein
MSIGPSRSSLYRWSRRLEPKSRRPHKPRQKTWSSELVRAVERLRQDFPMWGRAKIGPLLRADGFAASDPTVGRIIASLVERGVVEPVPALRRRPHGALAGQTPAQYLATRQAAETRADPGHPVAIFEVSH